MGKVALHDASNKKTPRIRTERKFVYYVQPRSQACNRSIAQYLDELGLVDTNKKLLCYRGESHTVWQVPHDFLEQLNESRRHDPAIFCFRAFRHPMDDETAIVEHRFKGALAASPLLRKTKRDIDHVLKSRTVQKKGQEVSRR